MALATIHTNLADSVLTITLNRPEALNALDEDMSVELNAALRTAQRDENVRAVVLTGTGRAFCAGQDLKELTRLGNDVDIGTLLRQRYNPLIVRLRTIEKPVVAAINGVAAGGGASLALACDLRLAARGASFTMAFARIGLVPDCAATLTLVQNVGYARAAELCLLSEPISAEQAAEWGLINRVLDDEALREEADALARELAALPTRALGLTKRALNQAWTATLDGQLETEAYLQTTACKTHDHKEGVKAFLEKRAPRFQGR